MKKITLAFLIFITAHSFANVKLPNIFGDNMVLQQNRKIPVWGWADANEKIMVQFNNQTMSATAGKDGKWRVDLDEEKFGGPYQLTVKGNNTVSFKNVLVGEVWICSGQSNMEMPIEGWGKIMNYEEEITNANYPQIRQIKVPNTVSGKPKEDIPAANWKICSPQTAGDFTAAGYFFARELYNQLNVPVGLINTSWGGTHVETWTSRQAFENSEEFKDMIAGMPSLDLDSLSDMKKAESLKRIQDLQGEFSGNENSEDWKKPAFDDSHWPMMTLPGLWEQKQLGDLDGIVWFRKDLVLPASDAAKDAVLYLGMIDDNDSTYVNGVLIGATKGYNAMRKYHIPASVLKEGKNIIAVQVEDTGGGGGLYGDSAGLKIVQDNVPVYLGGSWRFHVEKIIGGSASVGPNSYPTLLFNAMINPLIPFAMRGVIWYQGESNAGRANQYAKAFPLMITDWRSRWQEGDFPFYFVQLASFNAANGNSTNGSTWAELREAQTKTLSLPNTGMAVTTDIGNAADIHPKDKQDVGKRLAAIALHNVYGKDIVYSGPMYESMKTDGNKVVLSFKHTGSGLMMKGDMLSGFEIAGSDKQFHKAVAKMEGDKVIVYSDSIDKPVAVRFGWADFAGADNLFNKEGFPAAPFRTDEWKGITEDQKFIVGQ